MTEEPGKGGWHRRHPWGIACLAAAVLVSAPVALAQNDADTTGEPINIGVRNPEGGQTVAAQKETEIIASTPKDTYGTRQSNKGDGGGAIYGCRSKLDTSSPQAVADPAKSTPCVRVNNLSDGKAFDFAFKGIVGGIIQSGNSFLNTNDKAAPFVTNATAVALGLNADRLDNQNAAEIVATARKKEGLDADTVDGKNASELMAQAASGCATGMIRAGASCIETAPRAEQTFQVAAEECGKEGRVLPSASTLQYARTLDGIDLGTGEIANDMLDAGNALNPATHTVIDDNGAYTANSVKTKKPFRCATT